jgi:hypothetical protein
MAPIASEMLFFVMTGGLLVFAAWSAVHVRRTPLDRRRKPAKELALVCALWAAALPLSTGDWIWSLVAVVPALLTSRIIANWWMKWPQ